MAHQYRIAFWNLENLFDVENSPRRTDKLERAIVSDLVGWDQALLDRKIAQLASIIGQMGGGNGPDMLGVCEVENKHVMDLLAVRANLGKTGSLINPPSADLDADDKVNVMDLLIVRASLGMGDGCP